ncbi:hypothetical protein QE450_001451 [Paenibacillus sp. SORGH_AS306]|uniref:hypothetical protein n=1 Tax=unclassified Paenibacillus TaxID=185978 RepID=UPI0027819D64|nr:MULTISPECIES: hypothetical protein [unclassified Paenibacillus]MDQ1233953.1 hypothetical protein [Paenibacillus sp. SORGH_AS_0306]MDR6110998.1 hypothetical protein [Paenibacillus sp. SORGH_AS_0338]
MELFTGLYSIVVCFLIIGVIWKLVSIPLSILTLIFSEQFTKIYLFVISMIPLYFMASCTILIGSTIKSGQPSLGLLIIGGLTFVIYSFADIAQKIGEAQDPNTYNIIHNQYYGLLAMIIFYIYSIFNQNLVMNLWNHKLIDLINWIYNIPILGWVILIIAIIYMIYILILFISILTVIVMPKR